MPSDETLREFARELAPIAKKYDIAHYREIDEQELAALKRFLELHFVDVAHIAAKRSVIHHDVRAPIDPTEVLITIIDEIGEEHETAELFTRHLLRLNSGMRSLRKFFGLRVESAEEVMYKRISRLAIGGSLDRPKVFRLDEYGNELVIAAWDDDECFDGTHRYCGGQIARLRATQTFDVLVCDKCHLRTYIPLHVRTHGELKL